MHKLLEWIRRDQGDAPPSREIDAEDVVDEFPDELADGYEPADE